MHFMTAALRLHTPQIHTWPTTSTQRVCNRPKQAELQTPLDPEPLPVVAKMSLREERLTQLIVDSRTVKNIVG
jgi:hypothetical protein